MTTVVNTPRNEDNSMVGLIVGLILAALIIVIFVFYGVPLLKNMTAQTPPTTNIDVHLPTPTPEPTPAQ